ncbi:MAG: hypothetical protein ACRDY6_10355 [Acidimicrobiia bacterium]
MRTTRTRQAGPLGADRVLVDVLREINELRRCRALPEYQPRTTAFRVPPRQRHLGTRCIRLLRHGS